MLEVIGDRESVFHRAIDVVPDLMGTMESLISLGVTRILTSGQKPTVPEGAQTIREMIRIANGRIQVQPGGGITPENAAWCRETIGMQMMHAALHRVRYDRSTLANPSIYFGGAVYPPEDRYAESDAGDLADYIRRANA
jgi:copper homeostasis protein